MDSKPAHRQIEIFLAFCTLDQNNHTPFNSFAVLFLANGTENGFQETGRTETVYCSPHPQYSTSFVINVQNDDSQSEQTVRVQLYDRKKDDTEQLEHHTALGSTTIPLSFILNAKHGHFTSKFDLLQDRKALLNINIEDVDVHNSENDTTVELELTASILRRTDWSRTLLNQRFELHRAHKHNNLDALPVWQVLYRSERVAKQSNSETSIEFSKALFSYRHFCNGDDKRRLRISVFATPVSRKKDNTELLVGSIEFTLRDICEVDPTQEVFQLEGGCEPVDECGCLFITRAEPTDYGSHFSFHLSYNNTNRFISTGDENCQSSRRHKAKYIVKKLTISRRERSGKLDISKELNSPVGELFSDDMGF